MLKFGGLVILLREFLHVDDLSEAILFVINNVSVEEIYNKGISHINIGSGEELSIHRFSIDD